MGATTTVASSGNNTLRVSMRHAGYRLREVNGRKMCVKVVREGNEWRAPLYEVLLRNPKAAANPDLSIKRRPPDVRVYSTSDLALSEDRMTEEGAFWLRETTQGVNKGQRVLSGEWRGHPANIKFVKPTDKKSPEGPDAFMYIQEIPIPGQQQAGSSSQAATTTPKQPTAPSIEDLMGETSGSSEAAKPSGSEAAARIFERDEPSVAEDGTVMF